MAKRKSFYDETVPVRKGKIWLENKFGPFFSDVEEVVAATFEKHPFGLPMFRDHYPNSSPLPIKYLKVMQKSFLLVSPMVKVIAFELKHNSDWGNVEPIRGLRAIYVEDDYYHRAHHRIFYEVACIKACYLVGHSTDCSGHGKQCKEHMDSLFAYLADRFKLEIQRADITYSAGIRAKEMLESEPAENYRRNSILTSRPSHGILRDILRENYAKSIFRQNPFKK